MDFVLDSSRDDHQWQSIQMSAGDDADSIENILPDTQCSLIDVGRNAPKFSFLIFENRFSSWNEK